MSHVFAHCQSSPIDYGNNNYKSVVDSSQEYKQMRREHAEQAMRDIQDEVTGQGRIDLVKSMEGV